jgi:hypothetical protein
LACFLHRLRVVVGAVFHSFAYYFGWSYLFDWLYEWNLNKEQNPERTAMQLNADDVTVCTTKILL